MRADVARRRRALAALMLAVVAAACGEGRAELEAVRTATAITFSIAVPEEERPAIQELLSRFQERTTERVNLELLSRFRSQPRSRVDLVTGVSAADLADRLRADRRRGRASIHLFAQDNLGLKPLVDQQLVADVSHVAIPAPVMPSMIPARFAGRRLFLPFRPNVRVAYADRQRLREAGVEPPRTVDELRSVAAKLKQAAGRPVVTLSLAEGDPAAVTVSEWIVSYGGDPLVLNDEGSVRAFEDLQQLWRDGLLARESLFAKFDTEVDNLSGGRAWLAQNWSFTSAVLASEGELDRFRVYAGWRGPVRAAHVIGGDVLGIPAHVSGRQRQVAEALARFLMSREAQEHLVQANAWPSIRPDAYRKVPEEARETFAAIQEALEDGWFRPVVSYWPEVTEAMSEAVDRILLQGQPVRPVLDEVHVAVARAARRHGATYPPP
ncbi:MAG TPA: extracellular solute-binding protein [Acidimicrobiales bacterium]|nr:extracellular solute-binding protein [Acidimicrobiales bacterium]